MAIRVALHHRTTYRYDRLVRLAPQVVRLRPAPHSRTPVTGYSLRVEPAQHFLNWQQDPQSNYLARLTFTELTREFSVEVGLVADMTVINPFDFFLEPYAEHFPFTYEPALAFELRPYLEAEAPGPRLAAWLASVSREPKQTSDFLVELNQRLQREIGYLIRMEPGVQAPEDTLKLASGSCRDSAWLLVHILRHLGLAARFVSGYLIQLVPDVKPLDGPAGPASDFTDLHAWTEVYLPGAGWIGLDPTSGLFAGEGHIPLAASPLPSSAAPISGLVDPCQVEFVHEMRVSRIHEDPRVTKPYTDQQWAEINALGERIDEELRAGDVRLTMGGEPTFVSIDNMDGPEWNTEALGPEKEHRAGLLIRRLSERYARGGLLHFGQGKWYPGEPLPRWAFTCYWRDDGTPLWRDPQWIAHPEQDYGHTNRHAEHFAEELARQLRIEPDYVIAAYEDPLEYIHKEKQLPINVEPGDNRLNDPEERDRMRRVFERGLDQPSGYVLPLAKYGPDWQSGLWMLRARHLFLVPGDSPVGLRLPLKSLPAVAEESKIYTVDPFAPPEPFGAHPYAMSRATPKTAQASVAVTPAEAPRQDVQEQTAGTPVDGPPADGTVRTALAIEARRGRVHVFMPPVASAVDYAELVAAVERTAARLGTPVLVEGYPPPYDARLKQVKVTPDPGVIEVNIQPASSWRELVEITTSLYEDARQCRLGTEKFMLDGRHTGTGGGNHIVMGGPKAADSPFLRRPDLLRSFVTYWVNHPSLSYLFSGMFVGPTSQAPRVDALYELELANSLVPEPGESPPPPWLVDRLYRNLLVDVTGNTHRSEFCIDKLYSPDSSTGRLGLVEMRGFEMPPHARMSLTTQLLIRAMMNWFWREPYRATLTRWGTRLHDEFLLPHFLERDFAAVLTDLRAAGYDFDLAWFAAHTEFRFPVHGRVVHDGVEMELRQAIEPWYVLGEEPEGGATSRFVDSSVERMQVMVRGLQPRRHVVTANRRRLPLRPTGVAGEWVCGLRYRAWQPPRCLHPTVGVHAPLLVELVDEPNRRSLGGCTYHVAHPGGRNYETFPVNANEAEARRLARFFSTGHTPGEFRPAPEEINPEFPTTLDLRR